MLVKIKPHSSFNKLFKHTEYVADIVTYKDLLFYLNAMHKSFIDYIRKQKHIGIEEGFVLLDKNLREITPDQLQFKHAKAGDVVHIVPAIIGGGGKRGGILAVLAIAAFAFVALPALAAGAAAGAAAPIGAVAGSSTAGALGLGSIMQNLAVNVGLALLSSAFMGSPPKEEQARDTGMFGSLTNSTASGTPIALHYGLVRIGGQMINGYVYSATHGKTETLNAFGDIATDGKDTAETVQQTELSSVLKGFNQYV